jgi:hypothetical protein
MADDKIMEALARIEHKQDLLLLSEKRVRRYPQVSDTGNKCPVCLQPINYNVDIEDSVVIRKCGCSTGKIPLDLKAFAPPVLPAKRNDNDRSDEDRNDSDGRLRRPGGK